MGRDYFKIKQMYGFLLSKFLQTHNSLKITKLTQFQQPRDVPKLWNGVKKKRGQGIFIGEGCYQLFEKQQTSVKPQCTSSTIYTMVKRLYHMSKYYLKGIPKSSVRPCGPAYIHVLFAECTYGGSPAYVSNKNRSIHLPDLV